MKEPPMAESGTHKAMDWKGLPPPAAARAQAEAAWRAMPAKKRRAMQLLKARSWARDQRGAELSIPEAAAELHCSPATARRRYHELREDGAVIILERRLPGYGKVANVYIPTVEYTGGGPPPKAVGSGPPVKQNAEPARQPAPQMAEIPKRRVKSSRDHSTTNVKAAASSTYQNKHEHASSTRPDVAARPEGEGDVTCREQSP
jgi:DNA-binding Lrp family transcriptional regulator